MQGLIFAAGLGTRLKPWTDSHPKALVPVGGTPMLGLVIRRMTDAGIRRIIINVHHFADQIEQYLASRTEWGADIVISDERDLLLDTGGAIKRAAAIIGDTDEPLLVHNADILTDINIATLAGCHASNNADVTLAVADRVSSRKLFFDTADRLKGWQNINSGETRPDNFIISDAMHSRAFAGVHIINPKRVLPLITAVTADVFGIVPFYLSNLSHLDIRGSDIPAGTLWFDVGRPEALAAANLSVNGLQSRK